MHLASGQDSAPHRALLQRPLTPGRCPCILLRAARAVPVGAFAGSDGTGMRKHTQSMMPYPAKVTFVTLGPVTPRCMDDMLWLGHVLHG